MTEELPRSCELIDLILILVVDVSYKFCVIKCELPFIQYQSFCCMNRIELIY